jgi:prolyl oligopeptidase
MFYKLMRVPLAILASILLAGPSLKADSAEDQLLWLEDSKSPKVEIWVKEENERAKKRLGTGPEYQERYDTAVKILTSNQTISLGYEINGFIYEVYKDAGRKEGVWRRSSWKNYVNKSPVWETVIDIDALNVEEKADYSFGFAYCLKPQNEHCLISFSYAGSDSKIWREFNLKTKTFVKDGFNIPLSKSSAAFKDESTVFLVDALTVASQNNFGNPRLIREWKRGQKIELAPVIYESEKSDPRTFFSQYPAEGRDITLFGSKKADGSYVSKIYQDNKLINLKLHDDLIVSGFYKNQIIASARRDSKEHEPGTIFSIPYENQVLSASSIVWKPNEKEYFDGAMLVNDSLYITLMKDISNSVIKISLADKKHAVEKLPLPAGAMITAGRMGESSDILSFTLQSSLLPTTVYFFDIKSQKLTKFASVAPSFDSSQMERVQKFAKSRDGTMIPYFLIGKKGLKRTDKNPTILFGYGGFGIRMLPIYMALSGKLWLEKGGYFAFANLRGGGEFGEDWHKAGKGKNKQNVFDDFIGIAEDLIATKVTSPRHLGITGGSNGGLLVAAVAVQRPELFNAVVSESPVLDMLRFHKLMAVGGNWIEEYGNPDVPEEAEYLRKYSPPHNLKANVKCPEILFLTSGNDDRVHPAHARKMAERMKDLKQPYLYSEAIGGGHFNGNISFQAESKALSTSFLWHKLGPESQE